VGEDCAGAVQLVPPARVPDLIAGGGGVHWLTTAEVATRLRELRRDPTAWHPHHTGQFSLAGAQAKTALYCDPDSGRWGEPWGAVPTTHILKPAVAGLDDHDLNEHLCLTAARLLGMTAAHSVVSAFADERVVVVERYDRWITATGQLARIHQEDLCQALGVLPTAKYQSDGGPGAEDIVDALRRNISPIGSAVTSVERFVDALIFNWLIGGTDAHAKNYSVLLAGAEVRLAPLYDLASALVYDGMYAPRLQMAMKIGGEYRIAAVAGRHWRRFAEAVRLDPDSVVDRVHELAAGLPDAFATAAGDPAVRELHSPMTDRVADRIAHAVAERERSLSR
jgi:serine/threonine-protein kinase HipA